MRLTHFNGALLNTYSAAISGAGYGSKTVAGTQALVSALGAAPRLRIWNHPTDRAAANLVGSVTVGAASIGPNNSLVVLPAAIGGPNTTTVNNPATPNSTNWRAEITSNDGSRVITGGRVKLASDTATTFAADDWVLTVDSSAFQAGQRWLVGTIQFSAVPGLDVRPPKPLATADGVITRITVKNPGTGSVTNPKVSFGLAVAEGDLPLTASLQVGPLGGGAGYTTQQDQESHWKFTAAVSFAAVSFVYPGTLAAGATVQLEVRRRVNVAPVRTASATMAQLTGATDFWRLYNHADGTLVAAVNHAAGGPERHPINGWGVNPTRGWELIRSGPVCMEWRFWQYAQRTSDSGYHRQIKSVWWVRRWADGACQVMEQTRQSNMTTTTPTGTVGPQSPGFTTYTGELHNGATILRHLSGNNDPRRATFAPAGVNVAENSITVTPGAAAFSTGCAVQFTTTGTLPAGIVAGTTYHIRNFGTNKFLFYRWRDAAYNENSAGLLDIADQGTGTHTVIPVEALYWAQGHYSCDPSVLPDWVGSTQGDMLVAVDQTYLTRKSRAIPPYRQANLIQPYTGTILPYYPNHIQGRRVLGDAGIQTDLSGGGDDAGDQRIGWLSSKEVDALVYQPLDERTVRHARVLATWVGDCGYYIDDPATGMPVYKRPSTFPTYPGAGSAFNNYRYHPNGDGSPPTPATPLPHSGAWYAYSMLADSSHWPSHWYGRYLATGDRWWFEQGKAMTLANVISFNIDWGQLFHFATWGTSRDSAWKIRTWSHVYHVCPQNDPLKEYFYDAIEHGMRASISWLTEPNSGSADWQRRFKATDTVMFGFQQGMWAQSMGMLGWQGYWLHSRAVWTTVRKYDFIDHDVELEPGVRGTLRVLPQYFVYTVDKVYETNPQQQPHPTWERLLAWYQRTGGFTFPSDYPAPSPTYVPFPLNEYFVNYPLESSGSNSYPAIHHMGLALNAMAGDAQCLKLYNRLRAATVRFREGQPAETFNISFNGSARYAAEYDAAYAEK